MPARSEAFVGAAQQMQGAPRGKPARRGGMKIEGMEEDDRFMLVGANVCGLRTGYVSLVNRGLGRGCLRALCGGPGFRLVASAVYSFIHSLL